MKTYILLFTLLTLSVFSCSKKEETPAKPEILTTEIGEENSKSAEAGGGLHVDIKVKAEGKIKNISLKINDPNDANAWNFSETYTEASGKLNTTFHKDIPISSEAKPGKYLFTFLVVDERGEQVELKKEITITAPASS